MELKAIKKEDEVMTSIKLPKKYLAALKNRDIEFKRFVMSAFREAFPKL